MDRDRPVVRPIEAEDARPVAEFLHRHLNPRVAVEAWHALLSPPWQVEAPNHGFQLVNDTGIVGAYVAVYSQRGTVETPRAFCNLAAFCVLDEHRAHSLRLVRALVRQPGFVFTDLSPSGNVIKLNERLGFSRIDTSTRISVNLPWLPTHGVRITSDTSEIARRLRGRDILIERDHRDAPACRHLLVIGDATYAYLIFRRDRRKGLRLFATPLYVGGDQELLRRSWHEVQTHLLLRHSLPFTLADRRTLGIIPRLGVDQRSPRPKMYRGDVRDADDIDYLYSELTLLEW